MSGIGTANVTYTVNNFRRMGNSKVHNRVTLAFGNSSLTYSAGGIPLVIGSLGCTTVVESLWVVEQATAGYLFQYITSTNKLAIFQTSGVAHAHGIVLNSNAGTTGTAAVNALTTQGLFTSGAALTVAAQAGTLGGIQSTTPTNSNLVEITGVAIAATTVVVELIGW